jgi:hypothetical protein
VAAAVSHHKAASHVKGMVSTMAAFSASQKPPFSGSEMGASLVPKPPFFATVSFSHNTSRSDCIVGFEVLTACRVRDIRSPSSFRTASADHGRGAKLPENPANSTLSGQNSM